MCGICGIYTLDLVEKEKRLFRDLLMLNVYRGVDGTGVIRVDQKEKKKKAEFKSLTQKSLLPSPAFVFSKEGKEIIFEEDSSADPICLIGHTRAATKGSVKIENQHPFEFPKCVGVHNGTIKKKFPFFNECETDSEAIYKNIDAVGLQKTLNRLEAFDSAYTLVWIDKEKKTLNFLRDGSRPLYLTFIASRRTLLWSSDYVDLMTVLYRNPDVHATSWEGKSDIGKRISQVEQETLYTLKLGEPPTEMRAFDAKGHENLNDLEWDYVDEKFYPPEELKELRAERIKSRNKSNANQFSHWREGRVHEIWDPIRGRYVKKVWDTAKNKYVPTEDDSDAPFEPDFPDSEMEGMFPYGGYMGGGTRSVTSMLPKTDQQIQDELDRALGTESPGKDKPDKTFAPDKDLQDSFKVDGIEDDTQFYEHWNEKLDEQGRKSLAWLNAPSKPESKTSPREENSGTSKLTEEARKFIEKHAHVPFSPAGSSGVKPPQERQSKTPEPPAGTSPKTQKELEYKLMRGCFGCGQVFTLEDIQKATEDKPVIHWYSRDVYCCDSCKTSSPGNWISMMFQGAL